MAATSSANMTKLDITTQLNDLRNLKDGWYDDYGKAPSHEGLDWLAAKFSSEYPDDLPRPYIYPMPEGGAQLEWDLGVNDVSLEVNLEAHEGYWHNLNLQTVKADTRLLRLDRRDEWQWLNSEIRRLAENDE